MGKLPLHEPVSLISGFIYSNIDAYVSVLNKLEGKFGPVLFESESFEFSHTKYYAQEMGDNLTRQFVSFEKPIMPDELSRAKTATNQIEEKFLNENGGRMVNIDPGLIGLANLILASTKDFAHRIYLGDGIFGEVTLIYEDRRYLALPWTYPDYKRDDVHEFLLRVRDSLKEQIISLRRKG